MHLHGTGLHERKQPIKHIKWFVKSAILFLKCTLKTIKKFSFTCSVYFNQSLQNVLGVLEQMETILRVMGAACLKVERRDTSERGERV